MLPVARGCADRYFSEVARKMTEAAELALETLHERNELLVKEGREVRVEEPEEIQRRDERSG